MWRTGVVVRSETVPVDQRWLGLDKRALPYAIVAVILVVVLRGVLPVIDDAVDWDNPTVAGDVIDLGEGIRITPPVGWQLETGIRVGEDVATPVNPDNSSVLLADGGATVTMVGASWDGTPTELLDQYARLRGASDASEDEDFELTGDQQSFTTTSGLTGVSAPYRSATGTGTAYAFVVPDDTGSTIGIVISVSGAEGALGDRQGEIDKMISSLSGSEQAR